MLKKASGDGISYTSVREEGNNFALFKPSSFHSCAQSSHYGYVWDGESISTVYEKVIFKR